MRPGKTSITGHTFCPSGKVDSDDFSHKKWALACANAQNQTHYLSYKPIRKRRRFASSFLCFILFRLRMLLGFRSLIANNDELRRIKEEFFQKGRFICREPMPGLMRMHASRLLCGCAHVCSFSPGCAQTFPLMCSHRVTTRFICEIVFSSIPTIVVSFPILTLRRWFRGRRFYLAGSGHVRL